MSWLMAAEHRVILHTTATFYHSQAVAAQQAQQQQQQQPPPASKATGKPTPAALRRAAQQQQATLDSEAKVAEVRRPLLLGVGPGTADSNAPRDGEVLLLSDEQQTTALRPHASSLWLQPARLSRQLVAFLSRDTGAVAESSGSGPSMSNVTAAPIDVWAVVCSRYKAGNSGALASLLGVKKVVSLSQLSRLLAAHIQPLPPPPVIPPSVMAPSAATMQLMAANRAAVAAAAAAAGQTAAAIKPTATGSQIAYTTPAPSHRPPAAPASDIPTARRGFMAAMLLSEPLSRLLGHRYLSRPSVVRHLWGYIRKHNLQRATEKRIIDCDPPLAAIMGTKSVTSAEHSSNSLIHLLARRAIRPFLRWLTRSPVAIA